MARKPTTSSNKSTTTNHANTGQAPPRRSARLIQTEVGKISHGDLVVVMGVGGPLVFKAVMGKADAGKAAAEAAQQTIATDLTGANGTMVKSTDEMQTHEPATKTKAIKATKKTADGLTGGKSATSNTKAKLTSPLPSLRRSTRHKAVQDDDSTEDESSDDDEDTEEIPDSTNWPRYKDDLPNAFNGEVDPQKNFISQAPLEVVDNILSFLILDHDPDLGVKEKEGGHKRRPHVLLSMAAMSKAFYHATESFAERFIARNDLAFDPYSAKAKAYYDRRVRRRSARIALKPQPKTSVIFRTKLLGKLRFKCAICFTWAGTSRGTFANAVAVCQSCEHAEHGRVLTLSDALKSYDLRDYMLLKSRTPAPRAKFTDLPAILYGSQYKGIGFPAFKKLTVFSFREKDVEMIADLVHGDFGQHMYEKLQARKMRNGKARRKRVRELVIKYHEEKLEVSTGEVARRYEQRLTSLRALAPDAKVKCHYKKPGCVCGGCYEDIGLCDRCGDVAGAGHADCYVCLDDFKDRRYTEYYNKLLGSPS